MSGRTWAKFYWGSAARDSYIHLRQFGSDVSFVCGEDNMDQRYDSPGLWDLDHLPEVSDPICPRCAEWIGERNFQWLCREVMEGK